MQFCLVLTPKPDSCFNGMSRHCDVPEVKETLQCLAILTCPNPNKPRKLKYRLYVLTEYDLSKIPVHLEESLNMVKYKEKVVHMDKNTFSTAQRICKREEVASMQQYVENAMENVIPYEITLQIQPEKICKSTVKDFQNFFGDNGFDCVLTVL